MKFIKVAALAAIVVSGSAMAGIINQGGWGHGHGHGQGGNAHGHDAGRYMLGQTKHYEEAADGSGKGLEGCSLGKHAALGCRAYDDQRHNAQQGFHQHGTVAHGEHILFIRNGF